jgi:hypothetical protein
MMIPTGTPTKDRNETACPSCGAATVQGQLVPTADIAGGILTAFLTGDMAASTLVSQHGKMVVQAFCVTCGFTWLPNQLYAVLAMAGEYGEPAQAKVREELQKMVEGGGVKGLWAKRVLNPDAPQSTGLKFVKGVLAE